MLPVRSAATPQDASDQSLAGLLCAVSLATDLAMGQPMEHGLRTAYIASRLADALGLSPDDRAGVFYGALLKDFG